MGGPGGDGPAAYASEDRSVAFNSAEPWSYDANGGFAAIDSWMPGRAWLVIKEVIHVLGFDHVRDATQVMNPVAGASAFGRGDLAGLRAAYPMADCNPVA